MSAVCTGGDHQGPAPAGGRGLGQRAAPMTDLRPGGLQPNRHRRGATPARQSHRPGAAPSTTVRQSDPSRRRTVPPAHRVPPRAVPMTTSHPNPDVADEVPWADGITEYDNRHDDTYLRLLDADSEGVAKDDMARRILGIDPDKEPERARKAVESHLARARWMDGRRLPLSPRRTPSRRVARIDLTRRVPPIARHPHPYARRPQRALTSCAPRRPPPPRNRPLLSVQAGRYPTGRIRPLGSVIRGHRFS